MSYTDSMRQTITVQTPKTGAAGSDAGGNPVFNAQVSGPARVVSKRKKIVKPDQSVVYSEYHVETVVPTTINDRVWIPGADTTDNQASRRWLNLEQTVDDSGAPCFYQGDL